MKSHQRELIVFYNPESSSDRKTVVYAKSISNHVKTYSHEQSPKTSTHWMSVLNKLDIDDPKILLNKAHPDYQSNIKGNEFSWTDWTQVLSRNPHLIKSPIAIRGSKAILCNSPTDILKLK